MRAIYRYSDNSFNKSRIATKQQCIDNFLKVFHGKVEAIIVIADNCNPESIRMLQDRPEVLTLHIANLGNAESFLYACRVALGVSQARDEDGLWYFCEDDYLHQPQAPALIEEGLAIADYVTAYDHPDMYHEGYNLAVKHGGEPTRVILTPSSHWKYTASTTMTVAMSAKTISEDMDVYEEYCKDNLPQDYKMWRQLIENRNRRLVCCIPGASTHCEVGFLSPLPDADWGIL